MKELFLTFCRKIRRSAGELATQILEMDDLEKMVDQIVINLPLPYEQRQKLLEAVTISERYELLGIMMANEIEIMQIRSEIQGKIKERIDKNQREYILREQLKLIREELGEDGTLNDADRFQEKAGKLKASKEVKEKILEEISGFAVWAAILQRAPWCAGILRRCWPCPGIKCLGTNIMNIEKAKEILQADHYGLEKVKERILNFWRSAR